MFFKLDIHEKTGKPFSIAASTALQTETVAYRDFIEATLSGAASARADAIEEIRFSVGFPKSIRTRIAARMALSRSEEAYAIVIDKVTRVYAATERGFIYAAATLAQLSEFGELESGLVYDAPIGSERGYRVFLPGRAGFADFYRMVDFLAYYKFNTIMLEIGGAMEYRRHPEINEKWEEFCKEAHRYSGRTKEIQFKTYGWHKNSIHCDNAEGDILTQEECRTLAAYCRSRGLRVIPECPSLSHCDFLVMAHPELREREADGHPDTYCPNHPDVYKYVFDILEEVIDVFSPTAINIGHDETYSIGVCPRCKGTPAPVLYAEDVKRIHAFLKERGVQTYMWGEKLLKAVANGKIPIGGSGHGEGLRKVPALFPCRDLLPRDITFLHWYWGFNYKYDKIYHERGLRVLYGNLHPLNVKKWNLRREWGINGGYVSNWGAFGEEYMQRNCQYIGLVSAAYAFWCDDFEARGEEEMVKACFAECYRQKCTKIKNPIRITHATKHDMPYITFYDGLFIEDEVYLIGHYELLYSDGTVATLPVRYGTHIGRSDYPEAYAKNGFRQLSYGTLPKKQGEEYAFEAVYENPEPQKLLTAVRYQPMPGKEDIAVELIGFSVEKRGGTLGQADETGEDATSTLTGVQV